MILYANIEYGNLIAILSTDKNKENIDREKFKSWILKKNIVKRNKIQNFDNG
jgi:hypothetical protein